MTTHIRPLGVPPEPTPRSCPECRGCGEIPDPKFRWSYGEPVMRSCPRCGGYGTLDHDDDEEE